MLISGILVVLFFSFSSANDSCWDWRTQSACKPLPQDPVIWIEHGGSDRMTYCNNIETGASVPYILSHYMKEGYVITHHAMAATRQSKHTPIYTSYSWMLVKDKQ